MFDRLAVICAHSSPLAPLGGKVTGGMNVYVRETTRQLARLGVGVDIFTAATPETDREIVPLAPGARLIHVEAGLHRETAADKMLIWRHAPELTQGIERFARENALEYDLIHAHYWISGWIGAQLHRLWKAPLVIMFHTLAALKNQVAHQHEHREPRLRRRQERSIISCADALVAASHHEKEMLAQEGGIGGGNIRVLPCGVDLDLFHPNGSNGTGAAAARDANRDGMVSVPPGKQLILYVGRLEPVKGLDELLGAMALLERRAPGRYHLAVVGGELRSEIRQANPYLQSLLKLCRELHLEDQVSFLGPVKHESLPVYYRRARVLAMPSRYESFGLVALEALACGLPVVASAVGGLRDFLRHGENSLLVEERSPEAFATLLERLLTDDTLHRRLAAGGLATASTLGWGLVAERLLDLYRGLVNSRYCDYEPCRLPWCPPHISPERCPIPSMG